jgi:hypothetical protein
MSGSASYGIRVENVSYESNFHAISTCVFFDCAFGIRMLGTAEDNIVTGCKFSDCPAPYRDGGERNKFSSNHIDTCTDGVTIDAGAIDPVVSDNTISTCSNDGIVQAGGATRAQIDLNYIYDATGSLIVDNGNSDGVIVDVDHFFRPFMFVDAGDAVLLQTAYDDIPSQSDIERPFPETAMVFSRYADAARAWVIEDLYLGFYVDSFSGHWNFTIRLRMGPNRESDPSLDLLVASEAFTDDGAGGTTQYSDPDNVVIDFGHNSGNLLYHAINPDLDDELYLTVQQQNGFDVNDYVEITLDDETVVGEGCYWQCRLRTQAFE